MKKLYRHLLLIIVYLFFAGLDLFLIHKGSTLFPSWAYIASCLYLTLCAIKELLSFISEVDKVYYQASQLELHKRILIAKNNEIKERSEVLASCQRLLEECRNELRITYKEARGL